MSPERFSSEKFSYKNGKSTKESDVYSLGVVIYEVRMVFVVLSLHLRQRTNRSSVGIDLSLTWLNGGPHRSYGKGSSHPDPRLGSQILFGKH